MSNDLAKGQVPRLAAATSIAKGDPLRPGLGVPPLPKPNVTRQQLVESLLDPQAQATACFLIAPSGYGKTTLLAQLAQRAHEAGRPVAWLTLAPEHGDPGMLLEAIREAAGLERRSGGPNWAALASQIETRGRVLLILDLLEALTDTPALPCLLDLMIHLRGCNAFVAGRGRGGLRLSRLILAGRIRLLGPRDLAFSSDEIKALGTELTTEQVVSIAKVTEGWPVAVSAFVRSLATLPAGDPHVVPSILGQYIDENLLADLDPASLRLLMEAATFQRFSAELLAGVPEPAHSRRDLAQLADRNIPVEALDAHPGWYRFNPVFQALLRQRLQHIDPDRSRALHRYAAGWFERGGCPVEALHHAIESADPELATIVMERAGGLRLSVRQGVSALRLPKQPSLSAAPDYPLVTLGQIFLKTVDGRIEEARTHFERLRASTGSFESLLVGDQVEDVRSLLEVLEIVLMIYEDREIDAPLIERLEKLLRDALDDEPGMLASAASMLAHAYTSVGRIEDAYTVADMGLASIRGIRADFPNFYLELQQINTAISLGRMREAALHAGNATELANRTPEARMSTFGILNVLKGVVHYENNELEAAESLLGAALRHDVLVNGYFEIYAMGFSAAVETAALLRDGSAVDAILAEASTIAVHRRMPRLALLVEILGMAAATTAGNFPYAMNLMQGPAVSGLLAQGAGPVSPWNMKLCTQSLYEAARLLNRLGRPRDARETIARIDRHYLQTCDARTRFLYQALAMEVAFSLHRKEEAAAFFTEAMNLGLEAGFVRRLLNCREQLLQVFDWMMGAGRPISTRIIEYCTSVLRAAEDRDSHLSIHKRLLQPRRERTQPTGSDLTARESEILSLVAEGLSTKEIAHRLAVTSSTVKTHRRNAFMKLGVKRRSQAIARARERMLI